LEELDEEDEGDLLIIVVVVVEGFDLFILVSSETLLNLE
jgi:hypothetical protein